MSQKDANPNGDHRFWETFFPFTKPGVFKVPGLFDP